MTEEEKLERQTPEDLPKEIPEEKLEAKIQPVEEPEPADTQTEHSDLAEAIAQAVARSLEQQDRAVTPAAPEAAPEPETAPPQEEGPEPETTPEPETAEAPEMAASETSESTEPPRAKPEKKRRWGRKQKDQEPVYRPAGDGKHIPRGRVHVSLRQSLRGAIAQVRERQRMDLPGPGASVSGALKHYERGAQMGRMTAPLRWIIAGLMAMALLGRRYSWMLLGFLGGEKGVTVALVLTLVAMALGYQSVLRGLKDMGYFRFGYESLLLVATVIAILDALLNHNPNTMLPMLCAGWCLTGSAQRMEHLAKLRSLRIMSTARKREAVRVRKNLWEHMDCIGRAPAGTTAFVRHVEETDSWHEGWSLFALPVLAVGLVVGAYVSAKTEQNYFSVLTTIFGCAMPVAAVLSSSRGYQILTMALGRGGVVSGWFGIKQLSGKKTVFTYDADLFPQGSITHKGVKVYGPYSPRVLVSCGASLVLKGNDSLRMPFTRLLRETGGQLTEVRDFQVTEGGLSGWIDRVFVAVGTYNFMQLMGAMPPQDAPKNGLFIALNGQIAGLFAVKYRVRGGSIQGFRRLVRQPRLTPLAAMKNMSVNPAYMKRWFDIPVGGIICPKVNTRWRLASPKCFSLGVTCGFLLREGIGSYSRLVAGSRWVHFLALAGMVLSMGYTVLVGALTVSRLLSGADLLSVSRLVALQLLLAIAIEVGARRAVS